MKIKPGDIFKLGEHYLGCGSSTDKEFVEQVIAKSGAAGKIKMVLTDPPYGVAYVESSFNKLGKEDVKKIANDHIQSEEEYALFTEAWLTAITPYLAHKNTIYIFNSDIMFCALRDGMKRAGLYYSQMLIWIKNSIVVGRKDYLPQHEVIAYGWYGRHEMNRPKAKSVIFHPKPSKAKLHPTMKPPALLRKILPNGTKIREYVYDPFGGSGSTLIACDHMERRCIMVEMEITYIETIIRRWEELNPAYKAELVSTKLADTKAKV